MTNHSKLPDNTPKLAPHLVCAGAAEAMEFYKKAFDAEEVIRLQAPDGNLMYGCVRINGEAVMLVDENPDYGLLSPKALGGTPVTIHIHAEDVDKRVEQAVAAGATVEMPVADMFWGDRYGVISDPYGHRWSIASPLGDQPLSESQLKEAAAEAFSGGRTPMD